MSHSANNDEQAIFAIIEDMFAAISWDGNKAPELDRFAAAVIPEAAIIPSARPAAPTTIAAFGQRMGGLYDNGAMTTFAERPLSSVVQIFGNIAVALGGYEAVVDGGEPSRGANAFLFVKDGDGWHVAAMAWDNERDDLRLPSCLGEPT